MIRCLTSMQLLSVKRPHHSKMVTLDQWRDAVKFLMGLGCNPTLTPAVQKQLEHRMNGQAMSHGEAVALLRELRWLVK